MAENDLNEIFQELLHEADKGETKALCEAIDFMAQLGLINKDTPQEILERYNHYVDELIKRGEIADLIYLASSFTNYDLDDEDKNPQEAMRLYQLAAENGISYGYECLGMFYYQGEFVPQNFETAYKFFTKEDGQKAVSTLYCLAEMYRLGVYVKKDTQKACDLYSQITSEEGKGVENDIYYWRAFYRLACAKHRGEGTEKDVKEALKLIKVAKKLFMNERDPIKPSERITRELIYDEFNSIQSEIEGEMISQDKEPSGAKGNQFNTVRMHIEPCNDNKLEHFEGLGNVWATLVSDEEKLNEELPFLIQKAVEEGELFKEDEDNSVKFISYPDESFFRFIVSLVETDKSYQVASFAPLPDGVSSTLKTEGIYEWENRIEGEVQAVAPFDQHHQTINFFDPLFVYNKDRYIKNKPVYVALSAIGFYCEKNDPETFIIDEGELYESYIEQFLEENPEATREDAPPLEVSNNSMTMFYQQEYTCEYQYRGIVIDVDEVEFNNKTVKKLTLIVIRGEKTEDVVALNMYIPIERLHEDYEPERGDEVVGTLMLIGTVIEKGDPVDTLNCN